MLRIGITGGIGSGKSTVAKVLESMGLPVFYSDSEAKKIVENDQQVADSIRNLLGDEAYIDGKYQRTYVAHKVFNNQGLLDQLNQIIHPAVRKNFSEFASRENTSFIFNEAAILFETGAFKTFDYTILVCSPKSLRTKRLLLRDNTTLEEIEARMDKQWSDEKKRELADWTIENNEKDSILKQIDDILKTLKTISR